MTLFLTSDDGKYTVAVSWSEYPTVLPNNYETAVSCPHNLNRSLGKRPAIHEQYDQTIRDYETAGYIYPVKPNLTEFSWYLPLFPVVRINATTTQTIWIGLERCNSS